MLAQVAQQHLQERLQKQQELQTQEDLQLVQQQKQGQMQNLVAAATAVAGSAEEAAGLAGAPEAETGVVVEEFFCGCNRNSSIRSFTISSRTRR